MPNENIQMGCPLKATVYLKLRLPLCDNLFRKGIRTKADVTPAIRALDNYITM